MMTPQQQTFRFVPRAGEPRRRNVVIEAGAGTGKTTAIVAEVLRILLSDQDVDPARIILVTFTEKAAAEIAERIRLAVSELALHFDDAPVAWPIGSEHPLFEVPAGEKEPYRRACLKQLSRIDDLHSQTIHSFCQSLLRQHAIEAGLDPQFRIIEGFERVQFLGSVYESWIDEETRLRPNADALREWETLLHHTGYLFQARQLIFGLIDRRDLLFDQQYTLGEIAELAPQLIDALKILRASTADSAIVRYVRAAAVPAAGSPIETWIEYFAPIASEIRNEDLRKDGTAEAMRLLRTDPKKKGRSMYDLLVSHRAADALLSLTRRFIARLDAEKRARGVLDFDDLLIQTLALLDNEVAVEEVRQQFDFLFVDEFQDTDRIQARIIDRLARDRFGAYVPGKTIVVGDPKQSIYGFRRADPELYHHMTDELLRGGAEPRRLDLQYRSEPALLEAVNRMFAIVLAGGDPDPNVFRPPYHELNAARETKHNDDAPFTLLACECDEGDDRFARQAEVMAQWIESHGHDYRRFAILFRRLTHVDAYLDVFDRRGIPYVLPPTRVFLDRPAPVDLVAVLRAIGYPTDRGAEISAARTPYFALTDSEIVEGGAAWSEFVRVIGLWRSVARQVTVSQLIDSIVEATNIEAVYAACADSGRSLRHLEHVRSIAFAYDQTNGGSVRQFVDEIDRRRNEPDEVEPALFDETRNAVRILTVHAAKGLEFESVILPDLQFGIQGADAFTVDQPPSLVLRNGIDSLSGFTRRSGERALRDIAGLRDDAENRRLFYVAVTRAKRDVAFVCNLTKPRKEGFAKYLAEALPLDASMWPEEGREITTINGITVALQKFAQPSADSRVRQRLIDRELEQRLASSAPVEDSRLGCPVVAGESRGWLPSSGNRHAGILLHRFLERWDGAAPVEPLFKALVAEQAVSAEVAARVEKRLATMRNSPMLQRIARAETVGREMPISLIDESGAIVAKRIDRVIHEDIGAMVIDYKSGEPSRERLEEDRAQVALYCAAMERLTGRAHRGMLWYIDDERDVAIEV